MKAIILLHEIYGRNSFIDRQCKKYQSLGFHVYCPDFYDKKVFDYKESDDAYIYFYRHVGLDAYHSVLNLLDELKRKYEDIYIIGYSVGATLAWRCSENSNCSGIVTCYGSRIREYLNVTPKCPVLLIFAERDCFDINSVRESLETVPNTKVELFHAEHGFLDPYSTHYNAIWAEEAENIIMRFLDRL